MAFDFENPVLPFPETKELEHKEIYCVGGGILVLKDKDNRICFDSTNALKLRDFLIEVYGEKIKERRKR